MSEKTTKKLKMMANVIYKYQPPNIIRKTTKQIFKDLKKIHAKKKAGNN